MEHKSPNSWNYFLLRFYKDILPFFSPLNKNIMIACCNYLQCSPCTLAFQSAFSSCLCSLLFLSQLHDGMKRMLHLTERHRENSGENM